MSRLRIIYKDGEKVAEFMDGVLFWASDAYEQEMHADYHVMPDFEPFVDTTGTLITGRAHWREHVKAHGGLELGHSDIKAQTDAWGKKKAAAQERYSRAAQFSKPVNVENPQLVPPSRLSIEIANRLHGRPAPDRKTLVQLALREVKRIHNRR